jgi:peptidoglycan hydrolase-like protein with peptidoglycan-binding domain
MAVEQLKGKIDSLKVQIFQLQTQLKDLLDQGLGNGTNNSGNGSSGIDMQNCVFDTNLQYGNTGDKVKCLQSFLGSQGKNIYHEAIVSGWFGPLTKQAVIRFQEKYAVDILDPLNLKKGTGYVGKNTRAKINEILSK